MVKEMKVSENRWRREKRVVFGGGDLDKERTSTLSQKPRVICARETAGIPARPANQRAPSAWLALHSYQPFRLSISHLTSWFRCDAAQCGPASSATFLLRRRLALLPFARAAPETMDVLAGCRCMPAMRMKGGMKGDQVSGRK